MGSVMAGLTRTTIADAKTAKGKGEIQILETSCLRNVKKDM